MKAKTAAKLIHNAKVYVKRGVFCDAVRIEGGRIVQIGREEALSGGGEERIDAEGSLVLPAFHDSHLHLYHLGRRDRMIDCRGVDSIAELIRRGRERIEKGRIPPGTYVQGAGLNPDCFRDEKRDLTRFDMDRISAEHPLLIRRHCGHTIYCNSLALRMAGIAETALPVQGGTVEKDGSGRPRGILRENAIALVKGPVPLPSKAEIGEDIRRAMQKALSLGITAVGSYDTDGPDFDDILEVFRTIYGPGGDAGTNGTFVRVCMQCGVSGSEAVLDSFIEKGLRTGQVFCGNAGGNAPENAGDGPLLKMGPVKLFIDGTLGGQTAWMRQPYSNNPENRGFPVLEEALFERLVKKADAAGLQTAVHAIGDAAVEAVIRAFEGCSRGNNPLRHAIIHCQITAQDLLERIARDGILAMVQPIFLADDMDVLESRIGADRASSSYAWGSMRRLGIHASYGTDAPVSPLDPLLGIAWAVRRQDPHTGRPGGGYFPAERVDVAAAIDAYTAASAYASFDETSLGRIAGGYLADLVFIDRDLFTIPVEDIHQAKVLRTMLAGRTVWEG